MISYQWWRKRDEYETRDETPRVKEVDHAAERPLGDQTSGVRRFRLNMRLNTAHPAHNRDSRR